MSVKRNAPASQKRKKQKPKTSPCVSGAHNAIVTSRAGKDLVSSLVSGLLTIGPRFGGAIDDAARRFQAAVDDRRAPDEYVEWMKKQGERVPGIGHRIKSKDNRDARVALLQAYARKFFPATKYLDYAVQVRSERERTGREKGRERWLFSFSFSFPTGASVREWAPPKEKTLRLSSQKNENILKTSKTGRGIHADEGGQPGPQRRWLHRRALPGPALVVRDVLRGEEEGKSFFFFRKSLRKGGGLTKSLKKKLKMKKTGRGPRGRAHRLPQRPLRPRARDRADRARAGPAEAAAAAVQAPLVSLSWCREGERGGEIEDRKGERGSVLLPSSCPL